MGPISFAHVQSFHHKGTFLSLAQLQTAYPVAVGGDFAFVDEIGSGPIQYAWSIDTDAWEPTSHPGSVVAHNTLSGLQGGHAPSNQYYHLTLAQHDHLAGDLIDGGDATGLHTHSVNDIASWTLSGPITVDGDTVSFATDVYIAESLRHVGDLNTRLKFQNELVQLEANGKILFTATGDSLPGYSVEVNRALEDTDFIIHGPSGEVFKYAYSTDDFLFSKGVTFDGGKGVLVNTDWSNPFTVRRNTNTGVSNINIETPWGVSHALSLGVYGNAYSEAGEFNDEAGNAVTTVGIGFIEMKDPDILHFATNGVSRFHLTPTGMQVDSAVIFNGLGQDRDFSILDSGGAEAFKYDAGDGTFQFTAGEDKALLSTAPSGNVDLAIATIGYVNDNAGLWDTDGTDLTPKTSGENIILTDADFIVQNTTGMAYAIIDSPNNAESTLRLKGNLSQWDVVLSGGDFCVVESGHDSTVKFQIDRLGNPAGQWLFLQSSEATFNIGYEDRDFEIRGSGAGTVGYRFDAGNVLHGWGRVPTDDFDFYKSSGNVELQLSTGDTSRIDLLLANDTNNVEARMISNGRLQLHSNGNYVGSFEAGITLRAFQVDTGELIVNPDSADYDFIVNTMTGVGLMVDASAMSLTGQFINIDDDSTHNVFVGWDARVASGFPAGSFNIILGDVETNLTTGQSNFFAGYLAGSDITTGIGNVIIGSQAGSNVAVGTTNLIALGSQAGQYGATNCVFLGEGTGRYMTGQMNVGIGDGTLQGSTTPANNTGQYNIALGYQSGLNVTTGSENIFLGRASGYLQSDTNYNIGIGRYTCYESIGYRNTGIGYEALRGTFGGTGYDNVGIGYLSGNKMHNSHSNVILGSLSAQMLNDGSYNVTIGNQAGRFLTDGGANVYLGNSAGLNRSISSNNIAIGQNAITGSGATADDNTGQGNVAIGTSAGNNLIDGSFNVILGYDSARYIEAGGYNTLIGRGVGHSIIDGSYNTIIGRDAGHLGADRSNNVAIGTFAGYRCEGDYSVFIGPNAGAYETGANKLFIDNSLRADEADGRIKAMIYGEFDTTRTNQNLFLNANVTVREDLVVDGGKLSSFGNPTAGNYSRFEADGTLVFKGDATVWKDNNISVNSMGPNNSANPDRVDYDATNIEVRAFDASTVEEICSGMEHKHDAKEDTDIQWHLHWFPTTTGTGNVVWGIEFVIKRGTTTVDSGTVSVTTATNGNAWEEIRVNVGALVGNSDMKIGDQVLFRVFRDASNASDTYGADAGIYTVGFHYEVDSAGSRQITTK